MENKRWIRCPICSNKTRTLSEVEKDYLDSIKVLEQKTKEK